MILIALSCARVGYRRDNLNFARRCMALPGVAAHSMIIEICPVGQQLRARGCRFAAVGQTASGKHGLSRAVRPSRRFAECASPVNLRSTTPEAESPRQILFTLLFIQPVVRSFASLTPKGASKMLRATGHARMVTLLSDCSLPSHRRIEDAGARVKCAHGIKACITLLELGLGPCSAAAKRQPSGARALMNKNCARFVGSQAGAKDFHL